LSERDFQPPGAQPRLDVEPVPVRVVFERRATGNPWQPFAWRPCAIEPGEPDSTLAVRLFVDEAEGYYLNLTTADPSVFVLWRLPGDESGVVSEDHPTPPHALAVTASYNEAGRWMDGGERVDRVPMPEPMQSWVAGYVTLHYVPERGRKRRGDKPSFMRREEFDAMTEREHAIHAAKPAASAGIGVNPDPGDDAGDRSERDEP